MKKTIVIGIGSRIMTDDGIGIYLVEELMEVKPDPHIIYVVGETDVDFCLGEAMDYEMLIIIDAYMSEKQTGEITVVSLEELENDSERGLYSAHGMHLLNRLRYKNNCNAVLLIGIEPFRVDYGFSLSNELQESYTHILDEVGRLISQFAAG